MAKWGMSVYRQSRRHLVHCGAMIVLAVFCLGNRPACDNRRPDISCDTDIPVNVLPGTCVAVDNPCESSGAWSRVDGLRLCDEPSGLFLSRITFRSLHPLRLEPTN